MTTVSRETLKKYIDRLPDSVSIDELFEKFLLIFEVEEAMQQSRKNEINIHEEVKEKYKKWLK